MPLQVVVRERSLNVQPGVFGMAVTVWLWRLWKWLTRLFTRKCEIQRFTEAKVPMEKRTLNIEQSLLSSKNKAVWSIATDGSVSVDEAIEILVKEKRLEDTPSVLDRLRPSLERIHSLTVIWIEVDSLSLQPFSPDNQEHETTLAELWKQLMPDSQLEARYTKQWQEIGFQGKDPATDFRGMGVLGLYCLHYFASNHQDVARSVLSHSHHPQHHYPYAMVGIHIVEIIHGWLRSSQLNSYLYTTCQQWPLCIDELMEIFSYLFYQFDQFWEQKKPENVMAFVPIKEEFKSLYEDKLAQTNLSLTMRL
jgi:hypothetical protein